MNKVELAGRVVKEVELMKSKEGKSYVRNTLAVKKDKDNTLFIDFIAGGKQAENLSEYVEKGNRLIIVGSIDLGEYTDKEGKKQKSISILVDEFYFVDFKAKK